MPYANKEDLKAWRKRYYQRNKEKIIQQTEAYRKTKPPEWRREITNKSYAKHKVKIQEKAKVKRTQNQVWDSCPICGNYEKLVRDHNHTTLQWREYICSHCNKLLGFCRENIEVLKNAIEYIQHWSEEKR